MTFPRNCRIIINPFKICKYFFFIYRKRITYLAWNEFNMILNYYCYAAYS